MNSPRLSTFLVFVTRQSLSGESGTLNERTIGEMVFERAPNYDPRDDNIVRSHASRLRIRLQEYFDGEGASEKLRVSIPRGSYVPIFEELEPNVQKAWPSLAPVKPTVPSQEARREADPLPAAAVRPRMSIFLAAAVLLAVAVVGSVSTLIYLGYHPSLQNTATHKLWAQMFNRNQETIIVPADSSLVITRLMVGHTIRLADYAGGQYRQATVCNKPCDPRMVETVESLRYTSMSDLEFAVKVTHIPEAIPDRTEIRYARDLELKDFKESNLILAGSEEADPWMAVVSGQMNFVVHDDSDAGPLHVENRNPKPGEKSDYPYDPHDGQHRGLATISFLPNLSGSGNIVVVQGFSLAGTQAAAEFVTNGRDLDALFPAYSGNLAKLPHFEILLTTVEINGMASRAVPLAWHVSP